MWAFQAGTVPFAPGLPVATNILGGLRMHVSTIIGEKGNAVYTVEPGQMLSDAVDV